MVVKKYWQMNFDPDELFFLIWYVIYVESNRSFEPMTHGVQENIWCREYTA